MNSKNMKKDFIWNMIGTTLNTFNSMFFMVVITRINGVDEAGIYTLLFAVACLLYNIGIYSGRTFQVTDRTGKINNTEYIVHRTITVSLMLVCGVIYALFKGLDSYRFILVLLLTFMKGLEAWSDVLYAIEQKNDELYKSGISYTIKALISLVIIILVDLIIHDLIVAFLIVDIACVLVTIFYDIPSIKKYVEKKFDFKNVLFLFQSGFFAFAYFFLNIYLSNATKYALDGRVSSAEQAKYSIILMPATLITLCAVYLLQPYINRLSELYVNNDVTKFRKTLKMISLGIIAIGVLAFIVGTFLGVPVLNLVYGVQLESYLFSLQLIIVGATFMAIITTLSTALTTFRNTKVQFYIYLVVSIVIYFLTGILVDQFGTTGAACSYLIATVLQFVLYFIAYKIDLKKWENHLQ